MGNGKSGGKASEAEEEQKEGKVTNPDWLKEQHRENIGLFTFLSQDLKSSRQALNPTYACQVLEL